MLSPSYGRSRPTCSLLGWKGRELGGMAGLQGLATSARLQENGPNQKYLGGTSAPHLCLKKWI